MYVLIYDVVGDYEVISSGAEENTDGSDEDDDDGDDDDNNDTERVRDAEAGNASFLDSNNSDSADDAGDSSDTEFSRAHKPLQGSYKTAEGITVTVVKGSIATQQVSVSHNICYLQYHRKCRHHEA